MKNDPTFKRFLEKRSQLLMRFDDLRSQVQAWIETDSDAPNMAQLAYFEALLSQRREVLDQLAANDEAVVDYLIGQRQHSEVS